MAGAPEGTEVITSRNNKGNNNLDLSYHNVSPMYRTMASGKRGHDRKMAQKTSWEPAGMHGNVRLVTVLTRQVLVLAL